MFSRALWINAALVGTAQALSFPPPAQFAAPARFGNDVTILAPPLKGKTMDSATMPIPKIALAEQAKSIAQSRGLAPELLHAVVTEESAFNVTAVSPKGAQGLTQIMPGTARDPGFGIAPLKDWSIAESLRFGADYLLAMLNRYGGNRRRALAAYNAGPGTVDRAGDRMPFKETERYVARICARVGCP